MLADTVEKIGEKEIKKVVQEIVKIKGMFTSSDVYNALSVNEGADIISIDFLLGVLVKRGFFARNSISGFVMYHLS